MPSAGAPLSMWDLFQHADWIVKFVMIGLLITSVAVWAIAIDKVLLYSRTRRAMDGFEQAFWSGQSLDELYRSLASRPTHSLAALFVAAMREWKRSVESQPRSFAGLQMRIEKVMDVTIQREIARLERHLLVLATVGSAGPLHRPVRDGLGHHDELSRHRRPADHIAGGGRSGHRRSSVCDRNWPRGCHTGDYFL